MTGSSIFDYVHLNDHAEIAEQLGLSLTGQSGLASPGSGIKIINICILLGIQIFYFASYQQIY
jgi:hypothetical protein